MLKFNKIYKEYDTPILGPLSLDIKKNSFVSILGSSGAGKSTLLRLASNLIKPTSGSVEYLNNEKPNIGFVFQDPTLLPWRSVLDNVLLPAELTSKNKKASKEKAYFWLSKVGLEGKENSLPNQLSGGQKMRVSIARAMVQDCSLLLMDEPFAALDEVSRNKLEDDLLDIWEKNKLTVLFVTHSVTEAVYLAERVLVMSSSPGKILDDVIITEKKLRDDGQQSSEFFSKINYLTNILKKENNE
jgi:NitT/TauT family transport system ATP-binding protein